MMIHGWSTSVENTINLEGWDEEYKTCHLFLSQGIVSFVIGLFVVGLYLFGFEQAAYAQDVAGSAVDLAEEVRDMPVSSTIRLLFILTALTFVPAMILAMTAIYTLCHCIFNDASGNRIAAVSTKSSADWFELILSLMIMSKPLTQVYDEAITPFMQGEMEVLDATETAMEPMRNFMLANTRRADLQTMLNISQTPDVETLEEIPSPVVVSLFLLSELKTAFVIGVKIYLPFLVLDIIVANILLGMGMMVLPPIIISLPFKIMLFVLMDGWTLLITSMTSSFYGV